MQRLRKPTLEMRLARSRAGRVILHLAAVFGDREFTWHARGVLRELQVARVWT
jgi:hypothetical protein